MKHLFRAVGLATAIALACGSSVAQPSPVPSTHPMPLASQTGRYVLGALQSGSGIASEYLLDTHSGRTWVRGCVQWDAQDKCTALGLRIVYFGDGAGGQLAVTPEGPKVSSDLRGFFDVDPGKKK